MATYTIPNSPSNISLIEFQAQSGKYGSLAKTAKFLVRIIPMGKFVSSMAAFSNELTYLCESAELPGRGFINADIRYYGPNFKLPFQTEYFDTTFTFLCRTESFERQMFDNWMEKINPTSTFDFNYRDDYASRIAVYQMAEYSNESETDAKATYGWTLWDAWPILVNTQPVTWADDNIQRLSVTFTFSKWTREGNPVDQSPIEYKLVNGKINGKDIIVTQNGKTIT